ncbi:MAG TPA: energy transducer TonB [Pyrinomonadaceae bacterium]|nr:energy transducer TonB [Pyrinomonadaceae bacterium]
MQTNLKRYLLMGWFALALGIIAVHDSQAAQPQSPERRLNVAVLDFGASQTARLAAELIAARLASSQIAIVDRDLTRSAARGTGYQGSLNLSVSEARNLGAAIGCDFYIIGDAQTLRRSSSVQPEYFESYASIFLVSARTGRLISWQRPSLQAATAAAAEKKLLDDLRKEEISQKYASILFQATIDERHERELAVELNTPVIEEAPGENVEVKGLRTPRPYRRFKPPYPDSAAVADAAGIVDVVVDLDREGEVNKIAVARWAGFGLDEAALNTVRKMHFSPALRDGVPIPIRVLLRYNFRRPE